MQPFCHYFLYGEIEVLKLYCKTFTDFVLICILSLGTQPRESSLMMQLLLMYHYIWGGYYPIGGASEIAHSIIPVIEKSGGKVLVRANVTKILIDGSGSAKGK